MKNLNKLTIVGHIGVGKTTTHFLAEKLETLKDRGIVVVDTSLDVEKVTKYKAPLPLPELKQISFVDYAPNDGRANRRERRRKNRK